MKIRLLTFIMLLSTAAALASIPKKAELASKHRAALKTLGIPVYIPSYLPKGFYLRSVNIQFDPNRNWDGYTLTYWGSGADGTAGELKVEGTRGGIGSVRQGDKLFPIRHPQLGKSELDWQSKKNYGVSEWLAASAKGPFFHVIAENYGDPMEVVRVVEGLRKME